MPLAWAHAEYVKLACSILEGRPVDRPEPLWARYRGRRPAVYLWYWSPQAPIRVMPAGMRLGFCLAESATVSWRVDGGEEQSLSTRELGMGVHVLRLPAVKNASLLEFRLSGKGETGEVRRVALTPPA